MESYRKIRNRVDQLNINLKRQYFSEKIIQFQGNMEESWRTIEQLLNKRSKSTNIDLISEKDTEIFTKREISYVMNKYFYSVGRDLAGKIYKSPNPLLSGDYDINPLKSTFTFNSILVQHVGEALSRIKVSKRFGNDNISSYFLKLAFPYIKTSLVLLFNHLLNQICSLINGKLPGLHLFLRRVTGHAKQTTGLFQFSQWLPGYFRN